MSHQRKIFANEAPASANRTGAFQLGQMKIADIWSGSNLFDWEAAEKNQLACAVTFFCCFHSNLLNIACILLQSRKKKLSMSETLSGLTNWEWGGSFLCRCRAKGSEFPTLVCLSCLKCNKTKKKGTEALSHLSFLHCYLTHAGFRSVWWQ